MIFFYYNPETRMGHVYEPLTPEDAEFIAKGIGVYMAMYIAAAIITALVILPFLIASGMDKFLISFCSVNKTFLICTAIALILIRFFTFSLSRSIFIRFLFALMVITPVLYILLYKLHMAEVAIGIGKRFELTASFLKDTALETVWVDNTIESIRKSLSEVYMVIYNSAESIDYSAFSSPISSINIASVLLCIIKAIFWWGLLIVFSILLFLAGIAAIVIVIGFPYFVAFGVLILVNNLIYNIKLTYARHLRF